MSKPNPIELFVVHTLPDRRKQTFPKYKLAFSAFKKATSERGSAAMYVQRNGTWEKLYMSETYPSALSQPYLDADV